MVIKLNGLILVALGVSLAGFSSTTKAAPIYECKIDHLTNPMNPGETASQGTQAVREIWRKSRPVFLFDAESGLLRWKTPEGAQINADTFRIVDKGTNGNDVIGIFLGKCLVSCPTALIRIRPWESPTRAILVDYDGWLTQASCTP